MKILELEITKTRGIKYLKLKPNGGNMVIWGPNGSGKSAVVDAIDFLLTGKIARLVGEGRGGITLAAHGPHVDHEPNEAEVSAVIQIDGYRDPITLHRKMSSPTDLTYPPAAEAALKPILELASKGQHVLSRREILRYVTSEAGKRATEVQSLLNLGELESIRKILIKISGTAKAEKKSAILAVEKDRTSIAATLGLPLFDEQQVLQSVNLLRAKLKGPQVTSLKADLIQSGLNSQSPISATKVNPDLLEKDILEIEKILKSSPSDLIEPDNLLKELITDLCKDEKTTLEINKVKFLESGLNLISAEGSCPFCDKPWPDGDLKKHILEHIENAKVIVEKKKTLDKTASDLSGHILGYQNQVQNLLTAAQNLKLNEQEEFLITLKSAVQKYSDFLSDPIKSFLDKIPFGDLKTLLEEAQVKEVTEAIKQEAVKQSPTMTPEQTAWDTLTRLGENLKHLEETRAALKISEDFFNRSETIYNSFESARDESLASLYSTIEQRFSELYKQLHEHDDEGDFSSSIRPDGPSLVFEVDFHGRGMFHPAAMHSEGHQDTMGLCLYLALVERLNGSVIHLTILDDVVMSVDFNHRREVCHLIIDKFSTRQFIITTHDRTWARQLVTTGVVKRDNCIEFTKWSVDTGPAVRSEKEVWDKIQKDIDDADINGAAAKLRFSAEQFFEGVCENLHGKVVYKSDGNWSLGDYAPAGTHAYIKYLDMAKKSAQSWGDATRVEKIVEMETIAKQTIQLSQVEQWGLNENIHYSKWGTFTPGDFQPIVDAWRDLLGLFICSTCSSQIYLEKRGYEPTSVRCNCGFISWNLVKKPPA